MPRRAKVRFVEQTDTQGTVTVLQQRDIPDWRARDDQESDRQVEMERTGPYCQVFLNEMHRLTALNNAERRVVDMLIPRMQYGDPFYVSPTELAKEYGTALQNMSAMLKVLRDDQILIRVRGLYHVLDPRLLWQGSTRTRLDTILHLKQEGLLP